MISIILPTYNREGIIKRAIDSVLTQTFSDWELIIMDDGSTDETEHAVAKYLVDTRISFYKQINAGPIAARNNAAKIAKGDWLAFLDSDDEWLPEKLEKQWAKIKEANKEIVVFGNFYYINENNDKLGEFFGSKTKPYSGRILQRLLADNFVLTSSVVLPRQLFLNLGGFNRELNLVIGEDHELWLRLSGVLEFHYIPEPIVLYRVHSVQLTKKKLATYLSVLKLYLHLFLYQEKYIGLTKKMVVQGFFIRVKRIVFPGRRNMV